MTKDVVSKKPLVSILITNYNYAEYVEKTLLSAVNQDYDNLEIIIVDDGSTDDSVKLIKKIQKKYSKIKFITQKNRGVVAARNLLIDKSKGEYIVFLDSDDFLDYDYVSHMVSFAQEFEYDVVYSDIKTFDRVNKIIPFPEFNDKILRVSNFINISSLIKKSSIKNIRFDERLSRISHEDWEFYLNLSETLHLKFGHLGKTYLNYRIHDRGISRNTEDGDDIYIKSIQYIYDKHFAKNNMLYIEGALETFKHMSGYFIEKTEILDSSGFEGCTSLADFTNLADFTKEINKLRNDNKKLSETIRDIKNTKTWKTRKKVLSVFNRLNNGK